MCPCSRRWGGVGQLTNIELEQPLFSHNSHPTRQRLVPAFRCSAMEFLFSNARDPDFGKWPLWFSMHRANAIGPCIAEFHSSALLLAMLSSKRTALTDAESSEAPKQRDCEGPVVGPQRPAAKIAHLSGTCCGGTLSLYCSSICFLRGVSSCPGETETSNLSAAVISSTCVVFMQPSCLIHRITVS
jgi:hypothetical protein